MAQDKSNLENLHKSLRKRKSKFPLFLCIITIIAFSVLGAINAIETKTTYFDEVQATQFIETQDDLINNLSSLYNDKIVLVNDITINQEITIGTKENPFRGIFDGNGFEVKLTTSAPLFGYIGKEGKITELNLNHDSKVIVDHSFAPIAIENKGMIENCYIKSNISILSGDIFSSLVVYNKGIIQNCYIESNYKNNINNNEYIIGGISAINSGEILNSISIISFDKIPQTVANNIYTTPITNLTIGAVTGVNLTESKNDNNIMLISRDTFVCDINNNKIQILYSLEDLAKTTFFDKLTFNTEFWIWDEIKSCIKLRRGDGK